MAVQREPLTRLLWSLTWLSYGCFVGQQAPDALLRGAPWVIWVAKLLPLLIFLPGMLKDSLRSYVWLCFIALGYFVLGVERVFAQPHETVAWVGLSSVTLLFTAAMCYVRWRGREINPR